MKTLLVTLLTISGFLPLSLSEITSPFALIASISNETPSQSAYIKQKEIELIDNELESLMNLRDYYSNKMSRYRNKATRYELQGDNLEESKHLSIEAGKMESVINQIDEEIARLEKERLDLLKS